jgi:cation transporter-like permease
MRKFLIVAAAIALAVWYLRKAPKDATPAPSAGAATSPGPGCLMAAESANRSLAEATRLLVSMPVDTSKWSDAESLTSSAISSAESACRGGTTEAERAGMDVAREALTLMRATLIEGAHAALGAGGFQGAMRQEAIDNRLSAARGKFGLR